MDSYFIKRCSTAICSKVLERSYICTHLLIKLDSEVTCFSAWAQTLTVLNQAYVLKLEPSTSGLPTGSWKPEQILLHC